MYKGKNDQILENWNNFTYFINYISKDEKLNSVVSDNFQIYQNLASNNIALSNYQVGQYFRTPQVASFIIKEKNEDSEPVYQIVENCFDNFYKEVLTYLNYFPYTEIRIPEIKINGDQDDFDILINRLSVIMKEFGIYVSVYKM